MLETNAASGEVPLTPSPTTGAGAEEDAYAEDPDAAAEDSFEPTGAEDLPDTDPDDPDPGDTDPQPAPGGSGYVWRQPPEHLTTWWWTLPEQTRTSLAALHPGDTLDAVTARAAADVGLPCPRVLGVVAGRRVMRPIATAALVRSVQQARMAYSDRRLV